jgi:hypothetical protein
MMLQKLITDTWQEYHSHYAELPALPDGAPDALCFRALAAARFSFLSARKLVIREAKSRAQAR